MSVTPYVPSVRVPQPLQQTEAITPRTALPPVALDDFRVREDGLIGLMRLVLAGTGLFVVWVDPAEPDRFVTATYAFLVAYLAYSVVLFLSARRGLPARSRVLQWSHWGDLAWFTLLIALSSGTNSIFFFGFLFSILVAAFRRGRASGLRVTFASVLLFTTVGFLSLSPGTFELNRFLIRPAYLLVLGYMICYWGGYQLTLMKRLALLRDVSAVSNPRFGIDQTVGRVLSLVRSFYQADTCVLLLPGADRDHLAVHRCSLAADGSEAVSAQHVDAKSVSPLLALDDDAVIATVERDRTVTIARARTIDGNSDENIRGAAETVEARTLLTVPWGVRAGAGGRLFVAFRQAQSIDRSELDFLLHLVAQITPMLENVRLVDRLATDAADAERGRIARDLHDSVVQPYIGVRMALSAIRDKLRRDENAIRDVEHLDEMMDLEIRDLRQYLAGLKKRGRSKGVLADALQRYATRFSDATGIDVQLDVGDALRLDDRLAAEVFQLIVEGLSNVRRHSDSSRVLVRITSRRNDLLLDVEDYGSTVPTTFTPKSMDERVAALGGRLHVDQHGRAGSAVRIAIPL